MKGRYKQEKARRKVAEAESEAWEYKSSELEAELQQSQNRQITGMDGRNLRSQVLAIKYRLHKGTINAAAPRETSFKQGVYHRMKFEPDSAEEEKNSASLHVGVIDQKKLRSDIDREYMKRMVRAKVEESNSRNMRKITSICLSSTTSKPQSRFRSGRRSNELIPMGAGGQKSHGFYLLIIRS